MATVAAPAPADEWAFVQTDDDGAVFISESPNSHDRMDVSASIMRSLILHDDKRQAAVRSPVSSPPTTKTEWATLSAPHIFVCHKCKTHLSAVTDLESKAFRGRHGAAYLFGSVVNVDEGVLEDRKLLTGLHTVRDVNCGKCSTLLGWKYESAVEVPQKWKEGKYILEKAVIEKVDKEVADKKV